eukprot:scaffold4510_cov183-Amphora_coffeaeformis.AAC.6
MSSRTGTISSQYSSVSPDLCSPSSSLLDEVERKDKKSRLRVLEKLMVVDLLWFVANGTTTEVDGRWRRGLLLRYYFLIGLFGDGSYPFPCHKSHGPDTAAAPGPALLSKKRTTSNIRISGLPSRNHVVALSWEFERASIADARWWNNF